jgi:RNA polymerase sigma-70 factor (ECF subfamily)
MRRRTKRETLMEEIGQMADQPPPDPSLRDALDRLPENLRLPVLLFYMEGFSVGEIAGMLKVPSGTIKWRLSKARKLLKDELSEKGVTQHGGF